MPITPTNQAKNTISPSGARKAGLYLWGDPVGTWGDTVATWGGSGLVSATNQSKSSTGSSTILAGTPIGLLLALTYANNITTGATWINTNKN